MPRIDGGFIVYVIEHKSWLKSPWLKPNEALEECGGEWALSNKDYFSFNSDHSVWCKTDYCGWWNLKEAKAELRKLETRDKRGEFDYKYQGRKEQAVRHKFRISKITLYKKIEVVYWEGQETEEIE